MANLTHFMLEAQGVAIGGNIEVLGLVAQAGPVVKAVLLILLLMSLVSWTIIFSKYFTLKSVTKKSAKFLDLYNASDNLGKLFSSTKHIGGPFAEIFRAGYSEMLKVSRSSRSSQNPEVKSAPETITEDIGVTEFVERALKKTMSSEISKLENSLTFLATTGSSAPFIGLFGTVWGIMTSFIGLAGSDGIPTLQAVAPGIAEALIATAIGLAAAIPAVVAYNYFLNRVKRIDVEMENFSAEFLNIVEWYVKKV